MFLKETAPQPGLILVLEMSGTLGIPLNYVIQGGCTSPQAWNWVTDKETVWKEYL